MSYKLEYPYTEQERLDFIVQYNHNLGLRIEAVDNIVEEETDDVNYPTYFALEAFEKLVDDEVIDNTEEYEAEQAQKEREHIESLYLTGADVERGIYQAKRMDFDDIIALVTANPPQGLDIKALKIELKANHFYRGNPYVNAVGSLLGFTSEQLDKFFETNDYTVLLSVEVEDDNTDNIS